MGGSSASGVGNAAGRAGGKKESGVVAKFKANRDLDSLVGFIEDMQNGGSADSEEEGAAAKDDDDGDLDSMDDDDEIILF